VSQSANTSPNSEADRLQPTRAPACRAATGLTSDCESNVIRFPFMHKADSLFRQVDRVLSDTSSLFRHAEALSVELTMRQEPPQCRTSRVEKSV
jgi:hypothetical protein